MSWWPASSFRARPSETVLLLRGVGPALAAAPFSLTGTLGRPLLTVINNATGASLATNSWLGRRRHPHRHLRAGRRVCARPRTSTDAALVIDPPPGSYTAEVSGVSNTTGQALVEVYEVP